ncbi:hypothetical protein FHS74_005267 [Nitrospirillum iridis]|uniref:Uncharacterized protein n=1 Tax=Nitrospirillum iridis TaxID=765888 RepID=A0A7X0B2U9_9PROT|nr:hypothetical protein [Nitrospirillum iridis]
MTLSSRFSLTRRGRLLTSAPMLPTRQIRVMDLRIIDPVS